MRLCYSILACSPTLSLTLQVICGKCENVSEREEDFLDIPVALTGRGDLESALKEMFCDVELLEGSNQYRCERCNCLVDAKRVSWIHTRCTCITNTFLLYIFIMSFLSLSLLGC